MAAPALQALLIFFFLIGVSGRNYCYSGNSCLNSSQCFQNSGLLGSYGWGLCCNGRCQQSPPNTAYRGEWCDNVCTVCIANDRFGYLVCNNNVCELQTKPAPCSCSSNADCSTGLCLNSTCQLTSVMNGYGCTVSSQCSSGNCTNQKCVANPLGGACSTYGNGTCNNGWCNNTHVCVALSGAYGPCNEDSNCQSGLDCIGYNTTTSTSFCLKPPTLNEACLPANLTYSPCGETLDCNLGKCVAYVSVSNGGACDSQDACVSGNCNMTTGKCAAISYIPIGQNCTPDEFCANSGICSMGVCITPYSLPLGATCSEGGTCVNGSVCYMNSTTFAMTCLQVKCDPNSTLSDSVQCGSEDYYCGCSQTCEYGESGTGINNAVGDDDDADISTNCYIYEDAWYSYGYAWNPLTMTKDVLNAFILYSCCSGCTNASTYGSAGVTGYQISCNTGAGYSINQVNDCNMSAPDIPVLLHCDKFNANANQPNGANTLGSLCSLFPFVSAALLLFLFQ